MLPVRRTKRADNDLFEIWRGIATQNPDAADRVLDAMAVRWRQLSLFPFSGPSRHDMGLGIRSLVVGNYLTLYVVRSDEIRILRVLHGRRRVDSKSVE